MESVIVAENRIKSRLRNNGTRNLKNNKILNRNNNLLINKNNRNYCLTRSRSFRDKHVNNINNLNKLVNNNENHKGTIEVDYVYGPFTREVFNAICLRLGHTVHIPENSLQAVFNEMQLYPSKAQVSAMLQCARQCGKRNGNYVTFGEFCVLVKEMQKQSPKQQRNNQVNTFPKCKKNCEVFLGGSCNPTTWRADTAIPTLQREGISFYNPQVSMWAPELLAEEHSAKESASILFFVIDSQTRSVGGMIEVADLIATGRCVILVAYPYHQNQTIMGEIISHKEFRDLVDGQDGLLMLVKSRGIKVHKNLTTALQCTANILKNSSNNGLSPEQQITNKLRRLREVFDSYAGQKHELDLLKVIEAYEELTHRQLQTTDLQEYLARRGEPRANLTRVNFDKFCALIAEFSNDGCESRCRNDWSLRSFQSKTNNNSTNCNEELVMDLRNNSMDFDVYLGGSLRTKSNWRSEIAVPLLKKHGLSYYNPAIRENNGEILDNMTGGEVYENGNIMEATSNERILEWKRPIDRSKVALFYITNDTRSLTTMILAAYYIGLNQQKVVLCIQDLPTGCAIDNEKLSDQALKDYNRGRAYLTDLARRKNVPIHWQIEEALSTVLNLSQNR